MVGKSQLVDALVSRGAGRTAATAAVGAVLDEITSALASGERVTITGFGTFEAVARPERTARNPRTGESVAVAATTVVRFHPGAGLRGAVASGDAGPRASTGLDGLALSAAAPAAAGAPVAASVAPAAVAVDFKAGKELKAKSASKPAAKPAKASKDAKASKAATSLKDAKHHKDKHGKAKDAKAKGKKKK